MTTDKGPRTIADAAPLIQSGELTPSDLLEQCLARIDRYESKVRAWAYLDRGRARKDAERLTGELKKGHHRGPLHGIPVGIKDIIDVFDMPTGCGSKLWENSYARRDATCVERLRQAGAVIVGKTVTTAYASFDPPVTRNPWNLDCTPGGSSAGSAGVVACGMCLAALATQTGGSITRPASYCGVCSLKPTWARVSVDGVLPLAPSMDHVGVMANCVRDLAVVFQVIAGVNWPVPDCLHAIDSRDLNQLLAQARGLFDELSGPEVREALQRFRRRCDEAEFGFMVHDVLPPPSFLHVLTWHRIIMAVQAAEIHSERLRRHPDDYPPRITELIEDGLRRSATEYSDALEQQTNVQMQMDATIRHHPIWLTAAATGPAPPSDTTGDPSLNAPWSFAGLPTVSIPVDWSLEGLPLSIQLIGEERAEDRLLAAAVNCEDIAAFPRLTVPV
jgi:aspartyl-tRNA(Asn)/glutamyl-tRNA(Gln) amidotransferase subunit A